MELVTRILCDERPSSPVSGAYLYCQTPANQVSLFDTARFLVNNALISKLLILKAGPMSGYPGYENWRLLLQKSGIPGSCLEGVDIQPSALLHTLLESQALVRFAKEKGYDALFILAPPFQQLRAYMTAVTVALRDYPELSLYSWPADPVNWQESVVHSQGTVQAKRRELIALELDRIDRYQKKGDLASNEEVLAYLNMRRKS